MERANRVEVVRDKRNKSGDSRPARYYVVNSGPLRVGQTPKIKVFLESRHQFFLKPRRPYFLKWHRASNFLCRLSVV